MNEDELSFEFNDKNYTAKVVNSPYVCGDIFIPKIVKYHNNDYIITSISKYAFKGNKNIKSIKFPTDSKLTLIEKNAFYRSSIESIFLPPSVNEIEEGWCTSTPKLTSITVSPENALYQFYDDKFLLKKSQKDKEEYDVLLFARRDIKQGTIPPFISHICQYCFCDCKGLKSIQFSEESKLKSISKNSFFKSPITSIQIPPNLEKLEEGWCKGCLKLTKIILSPKNKNFLYLDDQFLIQKTNENLDFLNFATRDIKKASIPPFIKKIGSFSFYECKQLKSVEFAEENELYSIGKKSFYSTSIERISIPKSVVEIGKASFCGCKKLKTVHIPNNSMLCSIESQLFGLTLIEEIFIPKNVTSIDNKAFFMCNSLKFVNFEPNSKLRIVGENSFALTNIKNICFPSSVFEICSGALSNCYSLKTVDFERNSELNTIRENAFHSSTIESIKIPPSIKIIEKDAFYQCKELESFEIDENSEIKTFESCLFVESNLKSISIPANVVELKDEWCCGTKYLVNISVSKKNKNFVFYQDDFLLGKLDPKSEIYDVLLFVRRDIEHAIIPSFIKKISCYAFSECSKLKEVEFSENSELSIIDKQAFCYSSVEKISIPSSVSYIGEFAFNDCYCLLDIGNFENTKIRSIETDTFSWSAITSLTIPSTVEDLKEGWCKGTTNLKQVSISQQNEYFTKIDNKLIVGKSDKKSNVFDLLVFACRDIEEVVIPSFITQISAFSFTACTKFKKIEFQENSQLISIEENAFGATKIDKISIPSKTRKIGRFAFYDCNKLKRIEFQPDSNLSFIDEDAFNASSIVSISIPSGINNVKKRTFSACNCLSAIEFLGKEIKFDHLNEDEMNNLSIFSFPNAQKVLNLKNIVSKHCIIYINTGAEI